MSVTEAALGIFWQILCFVWLAAAADLCRKPPFGDRQSSEPDLGVVVSVWVRTTQEGLPLLLAAACESDVSFPIQLPE
jgi:hypothetical protein